MGSEHTGRRKYVSKVRRVTACSECHRRKQKCNRQKPCAGCSSRGQPDKCLYNTVASPQRPQSPPLTGSTVLDESPSVVDDSFTSIISNRIGYVNVDANENGFAPSTTLPNSAPARPRASPATLSQDMQRRFINLLDCVPEPVLARRFVDIFFTQANWYFSVLDRCFFDSRFRAFLIWFNSSPREGTTYEICYFTALLLQIIAVGLQFLPERDRSHPAILSFTESAPGDKSQTCSDTGDSILSLLHRRHPDLSSVEADIMRCAWLKNSGHGIDAWHSLSHAVRQAQDLKLHLEPVLPANEDTTAEYLHHIWHCEHKRRIWACLLTWDAHMSLQLGRPRMINLVDCTVRKPTNCDAPKDTSRTLLKESNRESSMQVPSHYTSHMVKYEIALMIHRAMNTGLLRPGIENIGLVHSMHFEVEQLLHDLPAVFRRHDPDTSWDIIDPTIPKLRLQIQIVADSFLLALHRPHIFTDPYSLKGAVQAAKNMLDLSQKLLELVEENQHKTFTLVFYTIDAGLFLAVALAKFSPTQLAQNVPRESLIETLEYSMSRLEFLESFHSVATAGRQVLKRCLDRLDDQRNHPVAIQLPPTPSPATGSEINEIEPVTDMSYEFNETSEFWTNLLNDSAFTATWLDNQVDLSVPDFTLFNENFPV